MAASADGRTAVVANYGGPTPGTTLSIIDVATRKERKRLALPGLVRPHGLYAIGSKIYLTAEANKVVARYDLAEDRIDWIGGTGQELTHMVVVTPGQQKVYTANIMSDSVSSISFADWPKKLTTKTIAVGKGPEGIDVSPDGKEVWVAQRGDGGISVIDTATDAVVKKLDGGKLPIRIKFTPDGKRVLVNDAPSREVLVFDAVTKELVKKVTIAEDPVGLVVAPDGKHAYLACTGAAKVAVLDLDMLTVTAWIEVGQQPDGLAWAVASAPRATPAAASDAAPTHD